MPIAEQSVRKPSRVYLRRGHPLTQDLEAAWPFYEGAGQTALRDVSGRQHHGTIKGDPAWDVGPVGRHLNFDGTGDFIDSGFAPFDDTDDFTFLCHFQFNSKPTAIIPFVAQRQSFSTMDWEMYYDNNAQGGEDDRMKLGFGESGESIGISGDTLLRWNAGVPVFIGVSKIGNNYTMYLGDSSGLTTSAATDSTTWTRSDNLQLMGWDDGGLVTDGRMANALLYSRGLTTPVVESVFEDPLAPYITKPR